jgi:hypothetical protein
MTDWTETHRKTLEQLTDAWVTPDTSLAVAAALAEIDRLQQRLGELVVECAKRIDHARDEGRAAALTPGCDCDQAGQPDPAVHASDCVWRQTVTAAAPPGAPRPA